MRRLYLAARFSDGDTLRKWKDELEELGFMVTSRWLTEHPRPGDDATRRRYAAEDLEDIKTADAFVLYNPTSVHGTGSGGRHVETGYAIACGLPVVIVGKRENVFHWADKVYTVEAFDGLLRWLKAEVGA